MFEYIKDKVLTFFVFLGGYYKMCFGVFLNIRRVFLDRKLILDQMVHVGVNSLMLMSIIGIFTGAVSCFQAAYQIKGLIPLSYLGSATSKAIIVELGPVLAALVLAGRIGASISAELGTMKVTEQIDALEAMAISPVRYLATPRVIAVTLMLPVLVIYASAIAILGSYLVATLFLDVSSAAFMNGFRGELEYKDLYTSIIKSLFFGLTISSIGVFIGFQTEGGAEGVGNTTIRSFVICAAMILIMDYVLWNFLLGGS